jgi:cyclopropane fatty-acyl-phospholipid synthase-like methyltransferase
MQFVDIYKDGKYLEKNPTWHVEESPFKAKYILNLLKKNNLAPKTVCEAGCGAGEVLKQLQSKMGADCEFWGYDISPQAINFSKSRENEKLHFRLADLGKEEGAFFDLMLVLDVVEHLEDYFSFLREIRSKARHKIFHFPLDLSAQAVARKNGMMKRRKDHAHLHYFTKELALQVLIDTGYEVQDWVYAPRSNEIGPTTVQKLFRVPRAMFYAVHSELAVRVLGGYTLMVLAK